MTLIAPTENVVVERTFGGSRSASKRSTISSRSTRKSSARSSLRSSIGLSDTSSPFGHPSSHSSPRSSLGQGTLSKLEEVEHAHWCTHGEHTDPMHTCDGWKRHEKEHDIHYVCMPNGLLENDGLGPHCALCGIFNPSPAHLDAHKASTCTEGPKVTRSRKSNLAKHLVSSHDVSAEDANDRAQKWRRESRKKKAFACGLCIKLFFSHTDQLNHIDHEHWSQGETMKSWSLTTMIRGLLLQPRVSDAWRYLLATSEPGLLESSFTWQLPTAEGLQLRLELCDETPQQLALSAFELGTRLPVAPGHDYAGPVGQSETPQIDFDLPGNPASTTAPPIPRIGPPSHATFFQRAALGTGRPTISPLNNLNTSKMEMCRPQSAQRNEPPFLRSPCANAPFFDSPISPQGLSNTSAVDTIQQPWPQSVQSTGSLPLDSNIQDSHSPLDQSHHDPILYSFFDDFLETDADRGNHPSSTNSNTPDFNHHDSPQGYLHVPYDPSVSTASFGDCQSGLQRHLRHPVGRFNGGKPLPALPAEPEDIHFDFS